MKRILFILLFALGLSFTLQAKVVTTAEASKAALTVMQTKDPGFTGTVASITPVVNNGVTCYYVVNFSPRGWALISADDQAAPLLGYGTNGSFKQTNMPENARNWLSLYSGEIKNIINENTGVRHKGWSSLAVASRASEDIVAPLITVHWNQPAPYNKYCPKNSSGTALVGCVAVATAQAMSVFQYPSRPKGNHGYTSATFGTLYIDYDKEADYNWSDIMSGANNKDEVARLLYHCGVAVNMNYGVNGSGAWTKDVVSALLDNFSYPGTVTYVTRASYSGDWKQLLVDELKAGRPIIFGANNEAGNAGHEFDLDGYDGSFFHVNWGWGGALEGYFSIDALGNSQTDVWTKYQDAVIGLQRPGNGPYDITLDANYVSESQPIGTKVGNIAVKSTVSNATYNYTIVGPYSPITHKNVEAPFEIKNGELLTTKVLTKSDSEEWKITVTATDAATNLSTNKNFTIYVVNASDLESPAKSVTLSYDKATRVLTISSTKTVSYGIVTSNSLSVSGTVTKDAPVSISFDKFDTAETKCNSCTLKLSNAIKTNTLNILLNK
jgi:hypothetical protein